MNILSRSIKRNSAVAIAVACLVSLAIPSAFSEGKENKVPQTPEAQQEFLEDALAEAIHTSDWEMVKLTTEGLKAFGLKGDALQIVVLKAERKAALFNAITHTRARLEIWGIAARHLAGDKSAKKELVLFSESEFPEIEPVTTQRRIDLKDDPKKLAQETNERKEFELRSYKRGLSVLMLAVLGEKDLVDKAIAGLKIKDEIHGYGLSQLVQIYALAALAADAEIAWKGISEFIKEKEYSRARNDVFIFLSSSRSQWNISSIPGSEQFKLSADIKKKLPKNYEKELLAHVHSIIKNYTPKKPEEAGNTHTIRGQNSIYHILRMVQNLPADETTVAALNGLKEKLTGRHGKYQKNTIDWTIKRIQNKDGAEPTPAKARIPRKANAPQTTQEKNTQKEQEQVDDEDF